MAIEIECEGCQSTIRVRDELAGRTGSCKRCGSSITIPRAEDTLEGRLLADATPDEMIRELRRRQLRAVLLLLDGEQSNPISGDQLPQDRTPLRAFGAEAFDQPQLAELFRGLANQAEQRGPAKPDGEANDAEGDTDVFDLKGDRLGMSLADFKKKHLRRVAGGRIAPLCSDEFPGRKIDELLSEPWHTVAGIVHARTDLPEENAPPTIAGAPTTLVLYQFLDGRLFQISAFFAPEAFHAVKSALISKFGQPLSDEQSTRHAQWWSMASTVNLVQGSLRPPQPTVLSYTHDDLIKEAGKRKPDVSADL